MISNVLLHSSSKAQPSKGSKTVAPAGDHRSLWGTFCMQKAHFNSKEEAVQITNVVLRVLPFRDLPMKWSGSRGFTMVQEENALWLWLQGPSSQSASKLAHLIDPHIARLLCVEHKGNHSIVSFSLWLWKWMSVSQQPSSEMWGFPNGPHFFFILCAVIVPWAARSCTLPRNSSSLNSVHIILYQ